jgi:DNA polymerase-3 subunit epsilon
VRHEGWVSEPRAFEAHGITPEYANDIGVPESLAISAFVELWSRAEIRIGHNEQFDARILRIGICRFPVIHPDVWKAGKAECTQSLATPILKLPPTERMRAAGFNKHKSANLREAYQHFMGVELVDAHSALADATACRDVYFAIKGREAQAA